MSFPNFEGYPPQNPEDGNAATAGAPGAQPQMPPVDNGGAQFQPPNPNAMPGQDQSGGDSKTTLWYVTIATTNARSAILTNV